MPALHPSSVAPEDFKVGDTVRYFAGSEGDVSPYLGKVVAIFPELYKVDVAWPVGGTQRMSPEELILVPPTAGVSVSSVDTDPMTDDKRKSAERYGLLEPERIARSFSDFMGMLKKKASTAVTPEKVTSMFAKKASEQVITEVEKKKAQGLSKKEVMASMYETYGASVPVDALHNAVKQSFAE